MRTKTKKKKKKAKHVGRWSRQQSSDEQPAENGKNIEENQHGPVPVLPNVEITT
jgi:hypothetical protein